jgi:superfamily II DNA helicase RecQ
VPWVDPGRFDDTELVEFLATRHVVEVFEHFFVHEKEPRLVLVVGYREVARGGAVSRGGGRRSPASVAPEEEANLTAEERRRYDVLRRWRNAASKRTGKPAYLVLTNRQAFQIAQRPPSSATELGDVPGIGPARIEEFGEALLAVLRDAIEPREQEATDGT